MLKGMQVTSPSASLTEWQKDKWQLSAWKKKHIKMERALSEIDCKRQI